MGKGGINRLLLTEANVVETNEVSTVYELKPTDPRTAHVRSLLAHSSTFTLRVAIEPTALHDAALATVRDDGAVNVVVSADLLRKAPSPPPVALLVAMQRPKVIGRVLESATALGVSVICVVGAEKVEKSYWDCKLFRDITAPAVLVDDDSSGSTPYPTPNHDVEKYSSDVAPQPHTQGLKSFPGRPRGPRNHPHRNFIELADASPRRVDTLPAVRRRLLEAVQQASADAIPPVVLLEQRGLSAVFSSVHPMWNYISIDATRVVTHPYAVANAPLEAVSSVVARGLPAAVIAIGPEGGWSDSELQMLTENSFSVASLGSRVLRSETATVVALGLAHEGLRIRENGNL